MAKEHDITTHIASLDEKSERDRSDGLTRLWINDFKHPAPTAVFNPDNKVRNVWNSIVDGQFRNRVCPTSELSAHFKRIIAHL